MSAFVDSLIQHFSVNEKADFQDPVWPFRKRVGLVVPGERFSCEFKNLKGADDAVGIIRVDSFGCFRVYVFKALVERFEPQAFSLGLQPFPDGRVLFPELKKPPGKGLDVKACTADYKDGTSYSMETRDHGICHGLKEGGAKRLIRVYHVNEMVRHAGALLFTRLGGTDVHVPVHLHGISADDLTPYRLGQGDSHFRFPHTGRTGDDDE